MDEITIRVLKAMLKDETNHPISLGMLAQKSSTSLVCLTPIVLHLEAVGVIKQCEGKYMLILKGESSSVRY